MAAKTKKRTKGKRTGNRRTVTKSRDGNTRTQRTGKPGTARSSSTRTQDVYDRERTRHQERGSRSRFTRFESDGKTKMRVVTFMHGRQECAFEPNFMHFNVPGERKAIRCPEKDCPICALEGEVPESVWKGNTAGRGGIKPSRKFVCNAVVRKGPDQKEDELQQRELPWSVWDGINKCIEDGEITNAFDLRKGVDFLVNRKTEKKFTKYSVTVIPASKPVKISVDPVDLIDALGDMPELKVLQKIADAIYAEVE